MGMIWGERREVGRGLTLLFWEASGGSLMLTQALPEAAEASQAGSARIRAVFFRDLVLFAKGKGTFMGV